MQNTPHDTKEEIEPSKHKVGVITNQLNELQLVSDATEPETQEETKEEEDEEFEDQFQDVYEEEELATEDQIQEAEREELEQEKKEVKQKSKQPQSQVNLFRKHKLKSDQEFVFDNSAYEMLHRCNPEWPCLSFDFLLDERRNIEAAVNSMNQSSDLTSPQYPMTVYLVSGSQADKAKDNKLYIMQWTNLCKTRYDDDPDGDSDDQELKDQTQSEPILYSETINHYGTVNRVRSMSGTPIVASWSDQGQVNIFDLSQWMTLLDQRHASSKLSKKRKDVKSKLAHFQMKEEGFALDWNKFKPGELAIGDCLGQISLFRSFDQCLSKWTKDEDLLTGHGGSVQDVEFSKTEAHVLGSVSVDGSIRLWDLREGKKSEFCKIDAHTCDVNVMSWSDKNGFLLASGADDGVFKVWDIRKTKSPKAEIKWHGEPITSISWAPHSDSIIAVTSEDDRLTLWDFAMEANDKEEKIYDEFGDLVPEQLMFVHAGQENLKELKFHNNKEGVIGTTSGNGLNILKPNLNEEEEEEEIE